MYMFALSDTPLPERLAEFVAQYPDHAYELTMFMIDLILDNFRDLTQ